MKAVSVILALTSAAQMAWAALPTHTQFEDENQVQLTIEIFDQERVSGEEFILIKGSDNREPLLVKMEKPSEESLNGTVFVEDATGEVLRDESLSLSFGSEYQQILQALQKEDFKAGFSYLPAKVPAKTVGFLMIVDNLTGDMRGYYLLPQLIKKRRAGN